jgi:hypothetical protein
MECSHCGSQNVKTFGMAHASHDVGVGSWHPAIRFFLLGPLGLLVRHGRNSVAGITAPPERPFPLWAAAFSFLLLSTMVWLVSIYLRRGLGYGETQTALAVNGVLLVVAAAVVVWDVARCVTARRRYPDILDKWSHTWICMQCGTVYEVREQLKSDPA